MLSVTIQKNKNIAVGNSNATFYSGPVSNVIGMAVYFGSGLLGSVGCVVDGTVIDNNDIKVRIAGFDLGFSRIS